MAKTIEVTRATYDATGKRRWFFRDYYSSLNEFGFVLTCNVDPKFLVIPKTDGKKLTDKTFILYSSAKNGKVDGYSNDEIYHEVFFRVKDLEAGEWGKSIFYNGEPEGSKSLICNPQMIEFFQKLNAWEDSGVSAYDYWWR